MTTQTIAVRLAGVMLGLTVGLLAAPLAGAQPTRTIPRIGLLDTDPPCPRPAPGTWFINWISS
jgi:hypothetical protein